MKIPKFVLAGLFAILSVTGLHAIIGAPYQMQLGNPSSATADTSNHAHYLIQRDQYALDFNDTTHEPNWVSWDLTTEDSGSAGRSPNFFQDTTLPAGFYQVLTTDYSGSGYDRGHMCPSADRTATRADNDVTFFMSNMVPQSPDNNQGVWANFETYCRTLAAAGNEILITSGPSGFGGSTVASGVAIPGYTWKIAVVVPVGPGSAVDRIIAAGAANIRVITIKIPNIAGVRSTPWEDFVTSVAQIQADTGYTFFANLPAGIASELRTVIDGQSAVGAPAFVVQPVPQSAPVGGTATFSVTASGNAPLSYQWFHDDVEIAGATSDILPLANVQAADVGSYYVVVTNDVGAATSAEASLIVTGLPPTITTQPVPRTVAAGTNVSFNVTAGGSAPFTYQWRKGGIPLGDAGNVSGSATPSLTLSNVQSGDTAGYDVLITNNVSSITSDLAALAVTPAAPTITSQPANRSLAPGSTATFSVVAVGTAPLAYQWRKDGVDLTGNPTAVTAALVLTGITLGDAGTYDVVVSNGVGLPATSNPASLSISSASATQIFYTGGTYVQDFNTLPASGTFANNFGGSATAVVPLSTAPINASGLGGWSLAQTLTSGTERFSVGTGSGNTGSVYSFGSTAAPDRALGLLSSSSNISVIGAVIVNNTGQTVSSVTVGYTGEQWRWGGSTGDKLSVEYQLGGSDIVSGTFTPLAGLDFASPVQSGTAGALDGNAAANRGARSAVLAGISWAPGQSLVIRWKQFRTTSADGLGVEDFSLSTAITGPTGPSVAATSPVDGATNLALNTAIAVTFDQGVLAAGSAFTINSAIRGAIPATVSASPDGKTYTLTPPANFDFSDTVSVKVFAAGVTSQSTGLHLAADYSFAFVTAAPVAPGITTQPASQTVAAGGTASFTVGTSGTAPFTYQWRKGGLAIAGNPTAATATLVLANVQAGDVAGYDVVVSNGVGSPATSNPATLTVTPTAPHITTQPVGQVVAVGDTVTLSVAATGSAPLSYQWRKGGTALANTGGVSGATTATLTLAGVTVLNSGSYDVVVSNGVGTPAMSAAVSVLVVAPPSVLNYAGGTYTQDFDTLPSAGTFSFTGIGPFSLDANPGVNAPGLAGWSFVKFAGSGANALFKFDNGGSNAGGVNSYGTTGASDRALGSVGSGSASSRVGVTMVNTSGHTIAFVTISYTGEQWRHGGAITPNKFTFSYAVGAPDINTGTFTAATDLDFTVPIVTTTTSALDGNAAANRVPGITATLTGLNWAPGQTLVLRWTDVDDTGSDDGIAIDDFSLTDAPPVPVITAQPADQTVPSFSPASFTVAATSATPLTFQWRRDGVAITTNPSALTATLLLASATAADAGAYDCVVTNPFGPAISGPATLATTKVAADVTLDALAATYDGTPKPAAALTTPAGLGVSFTYDGSPVAPTNAGSYAVVATIGDPDYFGEASGTLTIAKAAATMTLGNLAQVYDGATKSASASTTPAGLAVAFTYDGGPAAPVNVGNYAVVGMVTDANYTGSASGTLVIAKGTATVTLGGLAQTFDGTAKAATVTTAPAGLNVVTTYDGSPAAPVNAGSYAVVATVDSPNYNGSAGGTLVISAAEVTVVLDKLFQTYDGTPRPVSVITTPAGVPVTVTYDGSAPAPTYPGTYAVVATVDGTNRHGTASGTLLVTAQALVRHAPTLNGGVEGSLQVMTPEGITLNGSALVMGDLLVPGLPTVKLNGHPTFGGTLDATGAASPTNYTVTLNGNSLLRNLVRRINAVALPVVAAPPAPTGTRNVSLNKASDSPGDFATLRNLTLNGNFGSIAVPAGTYGTFTVNGGSSLILGVAGATQPAVYNLQGLTLNGNSDLQIVGPVIINLASGSSLNAPMGNDDHPEWLILNIAAGGLTLNGNSSLDGYVVAPAGTITINGNSTLTGGVVCDRLTINGNGLLKVENQ